MKERWTNCRLGDVCDIYQPQTISTKNLVENGQYKVYGANGIIGRYNEYNHEESEILLTCRGATCGAINVSEPYSWINGNAMVVHPCNGIITKDFLYYALKTLDYSKIITGAAQPQITRISLAPTKFKYPSLSEQDRIVKKLDEAFAKIDALKQNAEKGLQAVKDLWQATLKEELKPKEGWMQVSMNDVCSITSSLVDPRLPEYKDMLHVGGSNIESYTGKLSNLLTAEQEKLVSNKFYFDSSMVLYNKIRPYLVKIAMPDFEGLCSADMYPLKSKDELIIKEFLYYILNSKEFTEYAILGSARAGMPKVNRDCLFAYVFSIPKINVQRMIVSKLLQTEAICKEYQKLYDQELTEYEALKQSILRKAFSGEL